MNDEATPLLSLEDDFATGEGEDNLGSADVFRAGVEDVAGENGEVGFLGGL